MELMHISADPSATPPVADVADDSLSALAHVHPLHIELMRSPAFFSQKLQIEICWPT